MNDGDDWLWYGEDANANFHWCVGPKNECMDLRDDVVGDGDGLEIICAPISRIVEALRILSRAEED